MKYIHLLIFNVFCLWILPTSIFAQQKYIQPSFALPEHPRILLLKGEESLIQKTIDSDPVWKEIHQTILSTSDKILTLPPVERVLEGRRLLGKSSECFRRVFYLSYSWRMTKKQEYLERAEKELLAVSAFSDWNPSHFLDVAEMTLGAAIGYDWLYPGLSEKSRSIIREAIFKKGISLGFEETQRRADNWNQVCNAGISFGAMALFEDYSDLGSSIINKSISSIKLPMGEYYPDGAYPEGYGYWGYGTTFNVLFISALEKAFKSDFGLCSQPGFLKTAGYLLNMTGTSGKCFNYSDSGTGIGLHPPVFWFAAKTKDYSSLFIEKKILSMKSEASRDRLLPALLIWASGIDLNKVKAPENLVWVGQGKNPVALMRTSWTDPNAIFAGLKAGTASAGHSHLDTGSFVMDADGVRWAMDFGTEDYNSLESKGVDLWNLSQNSQRWQVFRYNNQTHNTLTINSESQSVTGTAAIAGYSSTPSYMSAVSDLSDVYKGQLSSAKRGIAIVDKSYVVVRDETETLDHETVLRWTMVTPAEVRITGKGTAELTQNGKKLFLKVQEPADLSLTTWTTSPPHAYETQNPGTSMVGFELKIPANRKSNFTVLLIPQEASGKSITTIMSLKDWPKTF